MWQRLFDAMVFCSTKGIPWDSVYNWNVDEFADVYHAIQRNEVRDHLVRFGALQQAFGGTKKTVKKFVDSLSVWLPAMERGGGVKQVDDFVSAAKKGFKLKNKE